MTLGSPLRALVGVTSFALLASAAACSSKSSPPAHDKPTSGDGSKHQAARAAESAEPSDDADEGEYGSLVDEEEFTATIGALPPSALTDPPGRKDPLPSSVLLTNLPALADQGTPKHPGAPGTCEAQSFGYALGAYTAGRTVDGKVRWDASKPENEPSAAFLYAWQQKLDGKKCGKGSKATPYLSRLVSMGAPSAADVPYEPKCPYLAGGSYLEKPWPNQGRLRIGGFAGFPLSKKTTDRLPTETTLGMLKELLAAGHAIAFSGRVLTKPTPADVVDGVRYGTTFKPDSGHGQVLVGYDDAKGSKDKPGAFLIQNSAPGGLRWFSYETFLATQRFGAIAFPRDDSPPTGQMLLVTGKGPAASITRAWQWRSDAQTYLILQHHFAEPVRIDTLSLGEPSKGKVASTRIRQFVQSAYTYLRRKDGKAFAPGTWTVRIEGETPHGEAVSYSGTIAVAALPGVASAPIGEVSGPTGDATAK